MISAHAEAEGNIRCAALSNSGVKDETAIYEDVQINTRQISKAVFEFAGCYRKRGGERNLHICDCYSILLFEESVSCLGPVNTQCVRRMLQI